MNEIKDKIVVISAYDSGEKDKRVLFYGITLGLGYAIVKGVKQPKAKLKFLVQPFCFSEVIFFERASGLTVKTADSLESFFEITKDYEKFEAGGLVLEVLKTASVQGEPSQALFIEVIKTLKQITYDDGIMPIIAALKFSWTVLENNGFGSLLDYEIKSKAIKEIITDILTNDDISFIKPNGSEIKELLKLLKTIFERKLNIKLKSI